MKIRYVSVALAAVLVMTFISLACADDLGDKLAQTLCTKQASGTVQLTADEARTWQQEHRGSYQSGATSYTFIKAANTDKAECGMRRPTGSITCGTAQITKSGRWLYLGSWDACPAKTIL